MRRKRKADEICLIMNRSICNAEAFVGTVPQRYTAFDQVPNIAHDFFVSICISYENRSETGLQRTP